MMREIGEQWIEVIDGEEHIVKAVEGVLCTGCMYSVMSLFGTDKRYNLHLCSYDGVCPVGAGDRYNLQIPDISIKDLGILKDGRLPCPFCGEYPTIKEELDENDERIYAVEHECNIFMTTGWNHDKQSVIDAWNRRA